MGGRRDESITHFLVNQKKAWVRDRVWVSRWLALEHPGCFLPTTGKVEPGSTLRKSAATATRCQDMHLPIQ